MRHKQAPHTPIDPHSHDSHTALSFINISTPHTHFNNLKRVYWSRRSVHAHTCTHLPSRQLLCSFLIREPSKWAEEGRLAEQGTQRLCTFLPSSWLPGNWHPWLKSDGTEMMRGNLIISSETLTHLLIWFSLFVSNLWSVCLASLPSCISLTLVHLPGSSPPFITPPPSPAFYFSITF